jgi:hypothetical protein
MTYAKERGPIWKKSKAKRTGAMGQVVKYLPKAQGPGFKLPTNKQSYVKGTQDPMKDLLMVKARKLSNKLSMVVLD